LSAVGRKCFSNGVTLLALPIIATAALGIKGNSDMLSSLFEISSCCYLGRADEQFFVLGFSIAVILRNPMSQWCCNDDHGRAEMAVGEREFIVNNT
jgi:hypothetical protein